MLCSFAVSPVFGKAQWVVSIQERDHGVQEAEADSGQGVWDVCAAGVGILSGAAVGQPYHSSTEMMWKLCSS